MPKIAMLGAGSTMFAARLVGDCMLTPALQDSHFALYDIDAARLRDSAAAARVYNAKMNAGRATITTHLGVRSRRAALRRADYVINAVQVGGSESTKLDFDIPRRYGLRQTIGDTMGIGGIFRALRTAPVMLDFARDMQDVCPDALMLNYTNPMGMITGVMLHGTPIRCVGLCHSVQGCARGLLLRLGLLDDVHEETSLRELGMADEDHRYQWKVAGINHQAWLLEFTDRGRDLYPMIKRRAAKLNAAARKPGREKHANMVRLEMMRHFGYYVTESSEHQAEYSPYWIKAAYPELVETFGIPLDKYLRTIEGSLDAWERRKADLTREGALPRHRSHEYASYILEALETDRAMRIHGNVLNRGLITNLPQRAVVEVPCLVDRNGIQGCVVGELPEQCAALNRTNINVQLLAIDAILAGNREGIYHAAYLDPHAGAELPLDQIRRLCDDLFEAHRDRLPAAMFAS